MDEGKIHPEHGRPPGMIHQVFTNPDIPYPLTEDRSVNTATATVNATATAPNTPNTEPPGEHLETQAEETKTAASRNPHPHTPSPTTMNDAILARIELAETVVKSIKNEKFDLSSLPKEFILNQCNRLERLFAEIEERIEQDEKQGTLCFDFQQPPTHNG